MLFVHDSLRPHQMQDQIQLYTIVYGDVQMLRPDGKSENEMELDRSCQNRILEK